MIGRTVRSIAGLALACALSLLAGCGSNSSPFAKVDGEWRYRSTRIPGADAATFVALDEHHAKDRQRVWFADTYRDGKEYFMIVHERVDAIAGADPASFRVLGNNYARDDARLYYEGNPFTVRDARTFALLDYGFARDAVTGYYDRVEIADSEGATFAVQGAHYAKDRRHVWFAETASDGGARRPYVRAVRLPGADAATFRVLEARYAVDAGQAWYDDRAISRNAAAFAFLAYDYAKDADTVFYRGRPVVGADAATFVPLVPPTDTADARDAKGMYLQGERVPVR